MAWDKFKDLTKEAIEAKIKAYLTGKQVFQRTAKSDEVNLVTKEYYVTLTVILDVNTNDFRAIAQGRRNVRINHFANPLKPICGEDFSLLITGKLTKEGKADVDGDLTVVRGADIPD